MPLASSTSIALNSRIIQGSNSHLPSDRCSIGTHVPTYSHQCLPSRTDSYSFVMNLDQSHFCSSCYWIRCVSLAYRASSASPLFVLCAVPVNQRILPRSRYPFKILLYSKALWTFQERQKAIDLFLSDNYSNSIQLSFFSRKTKDFHSYLFQPTGTLSPVRAFTTKSPVPTLQCPTFLPELWKPIRAHSPVRSMKWKTFELRIESLFERIGWIFLIKEQDMFFLYKKELLVREKRNMKV